MNLSGDKLSGPRAQRRRVPAPVSRKIAANHHDWNAPIVAAYQTGAYRYRKIGEYIGLHLATGGYVVRARS
ncbi:hypothetical protein [Acidihalobacter yilgarnensis]|uniref:hypothetical protein n=1 Tax=Acidihalobacter yilgarnensis TaxID=2819280 RepID=UPI0012EA0BA2|nr:hypothetical protein [Acidihalobacter yilgarnensis]